MHINTTNLIKADLKNKRSANTTTVGKSVMTIAVGYSYPVLN